MEKTPEQREKERKAARNEYLKRPAHFAECFWVKYGKSLEDMSQIDILKVFYIYCGCANQFSVTDYIRKLKSQQKAKK
jgi:hypothetical protein